MEVDPNDGKITFLEVDTDTFKIEVLSDVALLWRGMQVWAQSVIDAEGFVVYPFVKLEDLAK